ncbi:ribosomal large subunit pseudouridine synthase C [Candidatus Kinetoplastibacterium blastocrithidii TCC012E]|uniref:Pseudouridine synthase n=1 Tax=Candidatus Kinetoplastidibacterium blastocrithidiae TCC012E TaxID=1208922 RepID=M1LWJ0_9PROT|nr:RluA family pseudouridine synthase [Candidatus Kinetoplastibacterium blastocrithidii]AFZ83772.1 23S rRNA pseudouridine955/2504/2580 synthase [Candidatus Kinetoplastibacterium blastocrithidii (ex Strigomonas culicis)]AGF49897.1 ribosomal large subunit pseudouridine synthase C [Candidatus Kinetoplastibacterium blastocrithidii TCC012E]
MKNLTITEDLYGQRLDNFLLKICKGVPKSHIYKMIRTRYVKVNNKKVDINYRLQLSDIVSIFQLSVPASSRLQNSKILPRKFSVAYEDDYLLVINKPSGVAVHGGSGISFGVIEQVREYYKENSFLELVHRLDRDTSGLLILAKKRSTLLAMHSKLRDRLIDKRYVALVHGRWLNQRQHIKSSLSKWITKTGERRVKVDPNGQEAHTAVNLIRNYGDSCSLVEVELYSGRTHQIRVHLSSIGFPIVGDTKYGIDLSLFNEKISKLVSKRLFLHAHSLIFSHPNTEKNLKIVSDLPNDFSNLLIKLDGIC